MTKLSTFTIIGFALLSLLKAVPANAQTYAPPLKVDPMNSIVVESSGLQWAGNALWTFNDGPGTGSGAAAIYRIDTISKAILQTVNLEGAKNIDWEDIGFDGIYFYIGDFGNNYNGARNDLKIYKFPIAAIPTDYVNSPTVFISASQIDVINFSYTDQPLPLTPTAVANTTSYDCEAMFIDNGQIHLFTKDWINLTTTHYVINSLFPGTYALSPLETLNTGYLVTAADKAPTSQRVLLLGYQTSGLGAHFIHQLTGYSGGNYFNGAIKKINLPQAFSFESSLLSMGQAEGITFRTDNYGYISNESLTRFGITVNQKLRSFNTDAFPGQTVLPLKLLSFQAIHTNNLIKISWNFDTPVSQLQIQKSVGNVNNFISIKTYNTSKTDAYFDQTTNKVSYYRLVWSNENGGFLYSNILGLKSDISNALNNFHLKRNGELLFTLTGNTENYSIRITDINGRIIYKLSEKNYAVGENKIAIKSNLLANEMVFITLFNTTQTFTKQLLVEQ